MGKIRTRILGIDDVEEKQKKEQKRKSDEKKLEKKKEKAEAVADEKIETEKTDQESSKVAAKKEKKQENEKKESVKRIQGKKYLKSVKMVDVKKSYTIEEAVLLVKKMKYVKFDESVELHMNVDKTGLRGEVDLPHATGKQIRVAIVDTKLLESLENGKMDFDILITHPSFMPKLAKFAKILGPKGLMPNPKAGTISPKPEEVAEKFKKGMLKWKTEPKFPLIHQMIGKLSYEDTKLVENAKAFILSVGKTHISACYLTSTMTPSVRIDLEKIQ